MYNGNGLNYSREPHAFWVPSLSHIVNLLFWQKTNTLTQNLTTQTTQTTFQAYKMPRDKGNANVLTQSLRILRLWPKSKSSRKAATNANDNVNNAVTTAPFQPYESSTSSSNFNNANIMKGSSSSSSSNNDKNGLSSLEHSKKSRKKQKQIFVKQRKMSSHPPPMTSSSSSSNTNSNNANGLFDSMIFGFIFGIVFSHSYPKLAYNFAVYYFAAITLSLLGHHDYVIMSLYQHLYSMIMIYPYSSYGDEEEYVTNDNEDDGVDDLLLLDSSNMNVNTAKDDDVAIAVNELSGMGELRLSGRTITQQDDNSSQVLSPGLSSSVSDKPEMCKALESSSQQQQQQHNGSIESIRNSDDKNKNDPVERVIICDPEKRQLVPKNKIYDINTEYFVGQCLLMIRPPNDHPDQIAVKFFEGKQRRFEFQFQGKFIKIPHGPSK